MAPTYRVRITNPHGPRQEHDLKASTLVGAKSEATSKHAASIPFGGRMWLEELSGPTWRRVAYRETRKFSKNLTNWKRIGSGVVSP